MTNPNLIEELGEVIELTTNSIESAVVYRNSALMECDEVLMITELLLLKESRKQTELLERILKQSEK